MLAQPPLWFTIVTFLCALGPLVIFHELGHYWVARWFGVGAEKFSIFFGREITGWTDKRGTRWKIGWLPIGGYVQFVGDMNPVSLPDAGADLAPEVRPQAFNLRPWWQRFLIVLAGPATNFLLAIVIFAAFFMAFGMRNTPAIAGGIVPGSTADQIGMVKGDRILSIAGQATASFEDLQRIVSIRPNAEVVIRFEHDGMVKSVPARIGTDQFKDEFGQSQQIGLLGLQLPKPTYEPISVFAAIPAATGVTYKITRSTMDVIGQFITGQRSFKEVGGPLRIAQVTGQRASLGIFDFVFLLALFSINLGFINLLPVPVLDGGHLVFYAIEAVRRRPVSERAQEWAFGGGVVLIAALYLFTTFNDLASFGLFERLGRLIG